MPSNTTGRRRPKTEAQRQAQREADRKKAQEAVEALQSSEGWQRWLAVRRHFHSYSFINQVLIAQQCPHATRVAGFKAWLKLGYCVKKGESALRIWVPMPPTKRAIEEWKANGGRDEDKPKTRFRLGPVFDRSQVAPLPPPADPVALDPPVVPLQGDDLAWALAPLRALATELGLQVVIEPLPDGRGGSYCHETQTITLNERDSINERVSTFVHELGHALVRLEKPADDRPFTYAEEELVVESVAFTVCGSFGIDTGGASIPYLASWAQSATLDTIAEAAKTIDRIASRIEDAVLPADDRDERSAERAEQVAP